MAEVIIDGVEYVPKASIPDYTKEDKPVLNCLRELVSLHYFDEWRKAKSHTYDAIKAVSPELAELVNNNPAAAYYLLNGCENEN